MNFIKQAESEQINNTRDLFIAVKVCEEPATFSG